MAKRRLSLLVQAMNIFAQLDERDRATLADYVRSQTAVPRKKPEKQTKKKDQPLLKEAGKGEMCGICGHEEGYTDHYQPSPNYHAFESGKKKASAA